MPEIKLIANINADAKVLSGTSVILDLNGNTLTNVSGDTVTVDLGAELVLTDTSAGTKGTVDNISHAKAALFNNGTAVLSNGVNITRSQEKGTFSTEGGNGNGNSYYNIVNHGVMTIRDANVNQNGGYSSLIDNGYSKYSSGDVRTGYVSGTN